MATKLKLVQKQPPTSPDDIAFIEIIRSLIASPEIPLKDISTLTKANREIVEALDVAAKSDGLSGLWTVWSTLERDRPKLRDFRKIVEVPPAPKEEKEDRRFITTQDGKKLLKLDTISDIYAEPDPEYLITKILEVATVSLLYGMSGTGKTFTALDLALSVAHGLHWHGRKVKSGSVWYVNTEGKRGLKKRLQAWYTEHDELTLSPNFKAITWQLDIKDNFPEIIDTLESLDEKPALIVFDNFSLCAAGVNQNNQEEIAPVLKNLHIIAGEFSSHVMLIHHTNKEDKFNGSMAFRNHVDTMIELRKEDKEDKDSSILFTSQKARDDEQFGDIRTELRQVVLRTDEYGESVTSCVIVDAETPEKLVTQGLSDTEQDCLSILGDRYMASTEWQDECVKELKISTATFSRHQKKLKTKGYVVKCKVEGKRFEVYHAAYNVNEVVSE
jgi:DNA-binding MarR family transcriptional regulator